MSEQSETAGKGSAAASRSESKPAPKQGSQAEATLDDVATDAGTACTADLCQLGSKTGQWAGLKNYECPRCGYATVNEDAVRARNPKHFN